MAESTAPSLPHVVAVVTGASSGLGRAIAVALAGAGATVVAVGRDERALRALVDQIGGSVLPCDLREPGSAERVVQHTLNTHGRVDVMVANAGAGWAGAAAQMPSERIVELVELNVAAPLLLARACLPTMLAQGRGRLVFVSSIAGAVGVPGEAVYSATKAAVEMFADVLRAELVGTGVSTATVIPGVVRTEFFARRGTPYERRFPRPMSPERVAGAVLRLVAADGRTAVRPRWLWLPIRLRAAAPRIYRALERRLG